MPIEGTGIQAGTTITSVGSSSIVMSKTATANGTQSVRVFIDGYGTGGDSTTVAVQDCRGRGMAGRDNPLGSAAGVINATYFGMAATSMRAQGGSGYAALSTTHLPPYTPSGSVASTLNITSGPSVTVGFSGSGLDGGNLMASGSANSTYSINFSANVTSLFTGAAQGGNNTPFPTFQPTNIAECVIVVLP